MIAGANSLSHAPHKVMIIPKGHELSLSAYTTIRTIFTITMSLCPRVLLQ